ncbi:hypothetical protein [Mycolicibacterium baixiangningiae]|nr:hypothetical protein [Mycolicibacterium baixiangningiae]
MAVSRSGRPGPGADPAAAVEIVVDSDFGSGRIALYPDATTNAIWPPSN